MNMRHFSLSLICFVFLFSGLLSGQKSKLVIFSENEERFQVFVNGLVQNQQPSTHVQVNGLNPATYRVKVKFADAALGQVTKNMLIDPGQDYSVVVRKKKNTAVGGYFKEVGKAVDTSLGNESDSDSDAGADEVYVMRLVSMAPSSDQGNAGQGNSGNGSMGLSGTSAGQQPVQNSQNTQQNNSGGNSGSVGFNMSINASENGFNMNMNANDGMGGGNTNINMNTNTQSSQSTSSSWDNSGSGAVTSSPAPSTRCANVMSGASFSAAVKSIENQGFDESKLKVARQAISANCMSVAQIAQVIDMFGFEETKLNFAQYAYTYATDPQNYFQLNDHFSFSSSVDALDQYIQSLR